jgi:dienelactone hydrolase
MGDQVRTTLDSLSYWCCLALLMLASRQTNAGQVSRTESTRTQFLGVISRPQVPPAATPAKVVVENGYHQESLSFASAPGERVPLLILKQEQSSGKQAVVVSLHGTNQSKETMRPTLRTFADLGFIAVAMDAPYHGERELPIPGLSNPYQSALLKAYRTGEGRPYLYETVWDVMRLIDYLSTREDVDPAKIALVGFSKGGTEAYLAAAADPRISVVIPLIGVQSFGWSLRHGSAWEARTWTLRGATEAAAADSGSPVNATFLKKFYERIAPGLIDRFDGPAMLPLIAPRALLVVNGDSDPRSPLGGVREAVASAEQAYAAAGAPEKFSFFLEVDAAHEVTSEADSAVRQWLVRWLSKPAK